MLQLVSKKIAVIFYLVSLIQLPTIVLGMQSLSPTQYANKVDNLKNDYHQSGIKVIDMHPIDMNIVALTTVTESTFRQTAIKNMLAGWGVIQVLSILGNAIKRLAPLAIQPIIQKDLLPTQIVVMVLWCSYMIYTEGYQTFQLKYSPLVVKRAFGLSNNLSIMNCLFAGPYCMGLFGATKKRMIISWSVTLGVFGLIKIVKKLPYPWRSIVDAGAVLGLTYGVLAILFQTVRAFFGYISNVDECLPVKKSSEPVKSA